MRSGHQPVLPSGDDEYGTGDFRGGVLHRERRGVLQRVGFARTMAAHAEGFAREHRQRRPDLLPLERTRNADAGPDALLVGRGAWRVVAAQAHTPHGDFRGVEVGTGLDPVAGGARRALVVAADRDLVLGFALPRAVDREDRDAAREERLLVGVQLLFGRVQARRHDEDGQSARAGGLSQHAVQRLALERDRDALARRTHLRQRRLVALDRAQVRIAHLLQVVHEHELREVVVHRGANEMLAAAQLVPLLQRLAPERLVYLTALAPRRAPVLPALDPGGDLLEIGEQHPVRDEARCPVGDGRGDAWVGRLAFGCRFFAQAAALAPAACSGTPVRRWSSSKESPGTIRLAARPRGVTSITARSV